MIGIVMYTLDAVCVGLCVGNLIRARGDSKVTGWAVAGIVCNVLAAALWLPMLIKGVM